MDVSVLRCRVAILGSFIHACDLTLALCLPQISPFAVGHSLWHTDSKTGTKHMDGAFTMPFHPKTAHALGLPFSPEILMNVININLGLEKVKQFWKAGVAYGI